MSTDSPGSVPGPDPVPDPVPVPDARWVIPGLLLVGPYPSAIREVQVRQLLRALLAAGILLFLDLTPDGMLSPYDLLLVEESAGLGVETTYVRFPVPAGAVPPLAIVRRAVAAMSRSIGRGRPVYVHDGAGTGGAGAAGGGTGVAGTVVTCWLRERSPGLGADDAVGALTPAQRAFVDGWPHT